MIDDVLNAVRSLKPGVPFVTRCENGRYHVSDETGAPLISHEAIMAEVRRKRAFWSWQRAMRRSDRAMPREAEDAVADALAEGRSVGAHRLARYHAKRALRAQRPQI